MKIGMLTWLETPPAEAALIMVRDQADSPIARDRFAG
jgi:hypothetical protein